MKNIEELLLFFDYLEQRNETIREKLQLYYAKLEERTVACMNTYGIASPKEKCLMNDLKTITNLKGRLKKVASLKELEELLQQKVIATTDSIDIQNVQKELELVAEYKSSLKEKVMDKKKILS